MGKHFQPNGEKITISYKALGTLLVLLTIVAMSAGMVASYATLKSQVMQNTDTVEMTQDRARVNTERLIVLETRYEDITKKLDRIDQKLDKAIEG